MLTAATIASFNALCEGIQAKAAQHFEQLALQIQSEMVRAGSFLSSMTVQRMDRATADVIEASAQKIFDALSIAIGVEKLSNDPSIVSQIQTLYGARLNELAEMLIAARDMRTKPVGLRMTTGLELPKAREALAVELKTQSAKIHLLLTGMKSTGQTAQAVSNTFNIGGAVGAIQTGPGAIAHVTQTQTTSLQELTQALELIQVHLSTQASLDPVRRAEALDILDDVKKESAKEKPNSAKVGALLGGIKDTIQTIPTIAPAWTQVQAWYESIKALVS
ncbi:hypothetical protein [Variovorax sp. V116]|uniref:hypothetical protein n=1 Tax=Variovorax sp. V116 TaxID=3065953 RepID=UPI0034E864FC